MLKRELPYDPAISLLVIHPKINPLSKKKKILHHMSAAALFTIAKICKQPKYALKEELIKEIWYKNRILFSH